MGAFFFKGCYTNHSISDHGFPTAVPWSKAFKELYSPKSAPWFKTQAGNWYKLMYLPGEAKKTLQYHQIYNISSHSTNARLSLSVVTIVTRWLSRVKPAWSGKDCWLLGGKWRQSRASSSPDGHKHLLEKTTESIYSDGVDVTTQFTCEEKSNLANPRTIKVLIRT